METTREGTSDTYISILDPICEIDIRIERLPRITDAVISSSDTGQSIEFETTWNYSTMLERLHSVCALILKFGTVDEYVSDSHHIIGGMKGVR